MWYVIQVYSGKEHEIKSLIENTSGRDGFQRLFIPLYEEVRRRKEEYHILLRRLFPGYIFAETEDAEKLFMFLRKIPEFTKLLNSEEGDEKLFLEVGKEDQEFLDTLLDDGVMHVSYIEMDKRSNRMKKVVGPLARYRNCITHLETRHREAIVETEIFGKRRRIRFGLWMKGDPRIPWIEEQMEQPQQEVLEGLGQVDVGFHPGDFVLDRNRLYGEDPMRVERVDAGKRTVTVQIFLFGSYMNVELDMDSLEKV